MKRRKGRGRRKGRRRRGSREGGRGGESNEGERGGGGGGGGGRMRRRGLGNYYWACGNTEQAYIYNTVKPLMFIIHDLLASIKFSVLLEVQSII